MLTNKHVDIFEQEVLKYQKMLNLLDWEITFCFDNFGNKFDALTEYYYNARAVHMRLEKNQTLSVKELKKIARHEIWHVFDSVFEYIIRNRIQCDIKLEMEKRAIIMEKLILTKE